ncbi:MAG TPA: Fic family protein [Cellvibrionaceae bacterium]
MSNIGGEHYKYPGTEVLINKANLRTQHDLDAFEADVTAVRLLELIERPIEGVFNLPHLQAIHRHIFQDVYEWAGELRQADIQKGGSHFGNWVRFPRYLTKKLDCINQENFLQNLTPAAFISRLAHFMSEINPAHPFIEGNGRSQRAFCAQLADQAGYFVDFEFVEQEEMIRVMIASFKGNEDPLAKVLERITAIVE